VELLKNELLQAATNENVESLVMKVEQTSDDGAKRLAEVNARVGDTAAIVGMMASYNSATGKITVEAGLKAGIEESNIVLSGDHIILDGDVTIQNGFKLSGDHITANTITSAQIATATITANEIAGNTITAAEIHSGAITTDKIAAGAITADKIDAGAISVQNLVNAYGSSITFGSGIYIPGTWSTYIDEYGIKTNKACITEIGSYISGYINVTAGLSIAASTSGLVVWSKTDLQGPVYASGIADATHFTGAPNVRCAGSNNQLKIGDGSSRRFKHDIKPIEDKELNAQRLYDIPVIQFVYNDDYIDEDDQRYEQAVPGFIAEDIQEIYPIACDLEADGQAHDWNYRFIIPPMLALIQEQNKRIKRLEEAYAGDN
jgi:phage baseplate assembly protein gpV